MAPTVHTYTQASKMTWFAASSCRASKAVLQIDKKKKKTRETLERLLFFFSVTGVIVDDNGAEKIRVLQTAFYSKSMCI